MQQKRLSKVLTLAVILSLIVSLIVGCGNNDSGRSDSTEQGGTPSENVSQTGEGSEKNDDEKDDSEKAPSADSNNASDPAKGYDLALIESKVGHGGYELVEGQDDNWSYWIYLYTDDPLKSYVSIQDYIGSSSDVTVPETIEGYPVTEISATLSSNYASKTDIVNISFPDTLYFIASGVFDESTWYKNQPDGIVYAGKVVYKYKGDMPDGTEIEIPDGVIGIAGHAFENCTYLAKISLPDSLIIIANSAFNYCTSLSEVQMSENIMRMTAQVFRDCKSLESIYLPKSIHSSYGTFTKCNAIVYYEGSSEEWNRVLGASDIPAICGVDFPY